MFYGDIRKSELYILYSPVAQLVASLTADPGVGRSIPAQFHTFAPPAVSRRVYVSYKRQYVHKVLVNRLVKLALEKVWLGELTVLTLP